jgi:nitroreductase
MNEILKCLRERRSCRAYREDPVPEDVLDAVLCAGTYAPTGMNRQSPVMIVLRDAALIKRLSAMNAAVMGREGDPFYGAPVVVAVLADPSIPTWVQDGSLVIGNLLNAAHAVGLAGCWIHRAKEVFDSEEGKALLAGWGVDPGLRGVGFCILGYRADEMPEARPRKDGYTVKL